MDLRYSLAKPSIVLYSKAEFEWRSISKFESDLDQSGTKIKTKASTNISFIRFGSLNVKSELLFEDVSVLTVCKLNTNYAIKFYKCSEKILC